MKKRILPIFLAILILLLCSCSPKTEQAYNVNLLKNPGFEAETGSTVTDWALERYDTAAPVDYYGAAKVSDAPEGENILRIESPDYNDARFIQAVQVVPDSYYCLSAMVKTERIKRREADSGANICFLQTYSASEFIYEYSDWQRVTLYGQTGEDTDTVTVALRLGYYSADCLGVVYFDDVSLTRVESVPDGVVAASMDTFEFAAAEDSDDGDKQTPGEGKILANSVLSGLLSFAAVILFALWAVKSLGLKERDAYILIAIAFLLRLILSSTYHGFSVDIGCFAAWGNRMASAGPLKFYEEGYFCDYPPLYMLVCGLISLISAPFDITLTEGFGLVLLKLPAVTADILAAIIIMKISKKHVGEKLAVVLGISYAFLPTAILNSALWGQVDSILVLFMLITFHLIDKDKYGLSILTFTVGLLFKPQAILFGPVMLLGAFNEFYNIFTAFRARERADACGRLIRGFGYLLASAALFMLLTVLMRNGQSFSWLFDKYMNTLGSYNYATLSSFGFMGLIGGQWVDAEKASAVFGIPYSTLGTVFLVILILGAVAMFIKLLFFNKERLTGRWFWLLAAFVLAGAVTFSSRTHERYMFPAIMMLLMAFVHFKDIRLLFASIGYGILNFINTACVLFLYEEKQLYMDKDDPIFIIGSLLTVLLFVYQAYVTLSLVIDKNNLKTLSLAKKAAPKAAGGHTEAHTDTPLSRLLERRAFRLPKVRLRDIIICLVITALYAGIAFTNLGDTESPDSYWYTGKSQVYAVADLGQSKDFDAIGFLPASDDGSIDIYISDDGADYTKLSTVTTGARDEWCFALNPASARYIKLETASAVAIKEAVILKDNLPLEVQATDASYVPIDASTADAAFLFDDQESFTREGDLVPHTAYSENESHTVTFKKAVGIYDVKAYCRGTGTITVSVPSSMLAPDEASDSPWTAALRFNAGDTAAWCEGEFLINTDYLDAVERVLITTENVTVYELSFLDSLQPVKPDTITLEDGTAANVDFNNCFDETPSSWRITSVSDYVIADFGEVKKLNRGYYFTSLCAGTFTVAYSENGLDWAYARSATVEKSNLYYWHPLSTDSAARYVLVTADSPFMSLLEMGFFEQKSSAEPVKIASVSAYNTGENGGACLFDEQYLVPDEGATYMNSMYFDEIYHARTAYESATGQSIYEWTHPPLGKDMMSWCVSLMGMNPFAWRFAGTLAGVLMIPAMFFLGLLLFRKTAWATASAALMALDGMHYVQTRIATIDSFGVLFIILMFLFMYWYYSISFYDRPLWKTFIPLGLCGISFGLGAASKWICLYAGAGLAVIFFITVYRRWREYTVARAAVEKATGEEKKYLEHIISKFTVNTCYTLLFCILMFIIVPLIIYCASYYPYWNAVDETRAWYRIILDNQEAMFSYHANLEATHPYQSDWYTWPVMYLPMFYYSGPATADSMAAIYAFGNPAVWYSGLVCTILAVGVLLMRLFGQKLYLGAPVSNRLLNSFTAGEEGLNDNRERDTRTLIFLVLGLLCNLLPWVGISRCIFIYHYFASVPFIILFTVYMLRHLSRKKPAWGGIITVGLMLTALVLFIMFLPVWTGTPVKKDYVEDWLQWMPSWFAFWFK